MVVENEKKNVGWAWQEKGLWYCTWEDFAGFGEDLDDAVDDMAVDIISQHINGLEEGNACIMDVPLDLRILVKTSDEDDAQVFEATDFEILLPRKLEGQELALYTAMLRPTVDAD